MLVHKRQEWDYEYENQAALPLPQTRPAKEGKSDQGEINWPLRSKCLLLVLTVAFLAAVVTAQSAYIVKSGYGLVDAKREIIRLERANEMLRLDIAKLKTHERIAQTAAQKLGMIIPQNAYFSSGTAPHAANGALEPSGEEKSIMTGLLNMGFSSHSASERER